MNSTTADPGCRNGAFARLLVCALTNRPVLRMTCSCSSRLLLALNSTTLRRGWSRVVSGGVDEF